MCTYSATESSSSKHPGDWGRATGVIWGFEQVGTTTCVICCEDIFEELVGEVLGSYQCRPAPVVSLGGLSQQRDGSGDDERQKDESSG